MKVRFEVHHKAEVRHGKERVVELQLLAVRSKTEPGPWPANINPHGVLNFGGLLASEGDKFTLGQEYFLELTPAPPVETPVEAEK